MTIKIAISGTHSTGKTTLCNELYDIAIESGLNPCLLNEVARTVFAEHGCLPVGLPRDEIAVVQREIFLKQLQLEDVAEAADYDIIICDRTLMDCVVYARAHGVGGGMFKTFYRIAKHHLETYDYIAVTSIDPGISGIVAMDGLRDADHDFWYTIEHGIHEAVKPNISTDGLRTVARGIWV